MWEWVVSSSALILMIILIRRAFKGRIALRLQYGLWLLVLVRLLFPFSIFDTHVSVLNLLSHERESTDVMALDQPDTDVDWNMSEGESYPSWSAPMAGSFGQAASGTQAPADGENAEDHYEYQEYPEYHEYQGVLSDAIVTRNALFTAVWYIGMTAVSVIIITSNVIFYKKLRKERVFCGEEHSRLPVYCTDSLQTPCLFGVFRPAVYLNREVKEDRVARSFAIAHEESHYHNGDHIWSLFRTVCLILHWYNPLVWAAVYLSRQDSELACDELTIRRIGEENRQKYGRTLIALTAERFPAGDFLHCATTMTSDAKGIRERIVMIAKKPRTYVIAGYLLLLAVAVAAGVSFTGASEAENEELSVEAEEPDESSDKPLPGTPEKEEDTDIVSDPGVVIAQDDFYFAVATDTLIDNEYFSMEIPEELAGRVMYGARLETGENGMVYADHIEFFLINDTFDVEKVGPETTLHDIFWLNGPSGGGCLAYFNWEGLRDYERWELLPYIAEEAGTWDVTRLQYWLNNNSHNVRPVVMSLIDVNEAHTGGYYVTPPTDVQFYDEELWEAGAAAETALLEAAYTFESHRYPYEELDMIGEFPGLTSQ